GNHLSLVLPAPPDSGRSRREPRAVAACTAPLGSCPYGGPTAASVSRTSRGPFLDVAVHGRQSDLGASTPRRVHSGLSLLPRPPLPPRRPARQPDAGKPPARVGC